MQKSRNNVEEMKSLIFQAAYSLMADRPFTDISVQQICDQAHISRPTFYRYFSNKYDIPTWHMERYFKIGTFQIGRTLNWETGLLVTNTGLALSHKFYQGLDKTRFNEAFRNFGADAHKKNFIETITDYKHAEVTEKLMFQIDAFVVAKSAMTEKWVNSGLALPLEKEVNYVCSVVPRDLFELLNEPVIHNNEAVMSEIRSLFTIAKHEMEMNGKMAEMDTHAAEGR